MATPPMSNEASELIVRDFLIKAGLEKTLETLNEECREKSRTTPTVDAWYEMSTAVRLPDLLRTYDGGNSADLQQTPVVEVLVAHLRTLLGTSSQQAVDQTLLPVPSPPPKHDILQHSLEGPSAVRYSSISTAEYSVDGFESVTSANCSKATDPQELSPKQFENEQQRGMQQVVSVSVVDDAAESTVLVPAPYQNRSQHERKLRLIQTQTQDAPNFSIEPKADIVSSGYGGNDGHTPKGAADGKGKEKGGKNEKNGSGGGGGGGGGKKESRKSGSKKGEEAKHAEFYMPVDLRERMLHRSMEVLRANDESSSRLGTLLKTTQRVKLDDLRKCHEEEGFKLKKKRSCGLCEVKFSEVNLPVAVTVKAIYDLRHTWMLRREGQLEAAREAANRPGKGGGASSGMAESDGGGVGFALTASVSLSAVGSMAAKLEEKKEAAKRVTSLVHNGALLQPTRSYDQKRVCSFCAQFFEFDEVYRPSFGAKLAKLQEDKKQKEIAEDNKFWDPLMNPIRTVDTTSKKARQRSQKRQVRLDLEQSTQRSELLRLTASEGPKGKSDQKSPPRRGGSPPSALRRLGSCKGGGGGGARAGQGDPSSGAFFVAVSSNAKGGGLFQGGGHRTAVHGHGASRDAPSSARNKGLLELEKEKEALAFAEAAKKSAFWHAAATDTLMTKGLDSFKKSAKDRNLAKATVV